MLVEVETKVKQTIDISPEEAFQILCKTLDMEYVLDDETSYEIGVNEDDEKYVYVTENGRDKIYDDRGSLFIALRNVAVSAWPNIPYRSAPYIYE